MARSPKTFQVTIRNNGRTIACATDRTILQAAIAVVIHDRHGRPPGCPPDCPCEHGLKLAQSAMGHRLYLESPR